MTDIVKRLRAPAYWISGSSEGHEGDNSAPLDAADTITTLRAEVERLRVENIQMQAALGYAICAEDERHIIPSNPYSCGVCDANRGVHDEIERLRSALEAAADRLFDAGLNDAWADARAALQSERRTAMSDIVERLLDCAKDDHERGCQGREYDCSCGYDAKRDPLMVEAAKTICSLRDEVERLTKEALFTAITVLPDKDAEYATLCAEVERLRERLEWAAAVLGANGLAAQAFHARAALAEEKQDDR